jgi:hypothetical protein
MRPYASATLSFCAATGSTRFAWIDVPLLFASLRLCVRFFCFLVGVPIGRCSPQPFKGEREPDNGPAGQISAFS